MWHSAPVHATLCHGGQFSEHACAPKAQSFVPPFSQSTLCREKTVDTQMHGCFHARMDARMHGWMHGCTDARMHGCTDAWLQQKWHNVRLLHRYDCHLHAAYTHLFLIFDGDSKLAMGRKRDKVHGRLALQRCPCSCVCSPPQPPAAILYQCCSWCCTPTICT